MFLTPELSLITYILINFMYIVKLNILVDVLYLRIIKKLNFSKFSVNTETTSVDVFHHRMKLNFLHTIKFFYPLKLLSYFRKN